MVSGINAQFRKYRIGGIDTFGIVSPITIAWTSRQPAGITTMRLASDETAWIFDMWGSKQPKLMPLSELHTNSSVYALLKNCMCNF